MALPTKIIHVDPARCQGGLREGLDPGQAREIVDLATRETSRRLLVAVNPDPQGRARLVPLEETRCPHPLFTRRNVGIVRLLSGGRPQQPAVGPLRVLLVVSRFHAGDQEEASVTQVLQALTDIDSSGSTAVLVDVFDLDQWRKDRDSKGLCAGRYELRQELVRRCVAFRPHVLQLGGHGDIRRKGLVFGEEQTHDDPVLTARVLAHVLEQTGTIQVLVVWHCFALKCYGDVLLAQESGLRAVIVSHSAPTVADTDQQKALDLPTSLAWESLYMGLANSFEPLWLAVQAFRRCVHRRVLQETALRDGEETRDGKEKGPIPWGVTLYVAHEQMRVLETLERLAHRKHLAAVESMSPSTADLNMPSIHDGTARPISHVLLDDRDILVTGQDGPLREELLRGMAIELAVGGDRWRPLPVYLDTQRPPLEVPSGLEIGRWRIFVVHTERLGKSDAVRLAAVLSATRKRADARLVIEGASNSALAAALRAQGVPLEEACLGPRPPAHKAVTSPWTDETHAAYEAAMAARTPTEAAAR